MQKILSVVLSVFLFTATLPLFADSEKEADRVEESGTVMKEIIDIPDDIPKDLLPKISPVPVFCCRYLHSEESR